MCQDLPVATTTQQPTTPPHQTKHHWQGLTTCQCCLLALSVPLLLQLVKGGEYGLGIIGIRWAH